MTSVQRDELKINTHIVMGLFAAEHLLGREIDMDEWCDALQVAADEMSESLQRINAEDEGCSAD